MSAGVEDAFGFEYVGDEFDVAFVVLDVFVGFGKSFRREGSFETTLSHVRCAIVFGSLALLP